MKRLQAAVALCVAAAGCWSIAGNESDALAADPPPPTVVLLRLPTSDGVTAEAMARVNGELKAAGFDVQIVPLRTDDAKRDLETAGEELNAIAAFAIFVRPSEGGTSVAEIWVSDRIRQKIVIQNAVLHETDRGRGAEILAVRAVELLRANLAAFWTPAQSPPSDRVPPPIPPPILSGRENEDKARPPFASGLGVGLGAGMMEGFDALGASFSPDAMVSYGWPQGLSLRAVVVGLGSATTLAATSGSANVATQLALLEIAKTWWPRSSVVPFVTAGAGAQHVRVAGVGNAPYQGHTSDSWSPMSTLGVGVGFPLIWRLSVLVQVRGVAAWSPAVVQVAGAEVGRVGDPSLWVDGGLFGTLP